MNKEKEARARSLLRAFLEAGWAPKEIEALCAGDKLKTLREEMFPKPAPTSDISKILDLETDEVFTEAALEEIEKGLGTIHPRLMRILRRVKALHIRDVAKMTEREARRHLGAKSSKTYRAAEALLAKYGLRFGMKLP
jgi:hypothetical protein